MSAVRMCDRCGTTFSERAEGWTNMEATRTVKDPDTGRRRVITENLDACPACSGTSDVPEPRLAISGAMNEQQMADLADEIARRRNLEERLAPYTAKATLAEEARQRFATDLRASVAPEAPEPKRPMIHKEDTNP